MRKITSKKIQLHVSCKCGYNSVEPTIELIPYKNFKIFNVKVKRDKINGGKFLLMTENYEECFNCNPID